MYGEVETAARNSLGNSYTPSLTERLKAQREEAAKRLSELDAAIGALEANPQVQAVLDLVQKVARY